MKLKASDRKLLIVVILLGLVITGACLFMERHIQRVDATLEHYNTQLTNLENELAIKKAQFDASKDQVIQEATGLDSKRKTRDDDIVYDFLFSILNWDGMSQFNIKRTETLEKYNMSQTDRFAQVFLQPMPYTPETSELYNCRLDRVTSMVSGIRDTDYSYFSEVTAVVGGPNGVTSKLHLIFMYTVDADGNISKMDAYNGA